MHKDKAIQAIIDSVKADVISIEQGVKAIDRVNKMNKRARCCVSELSDRPVGVERKEPISSTHTTRTCPFCKDSIGFGETCGCGRSTNFKDGIWVE